MSRLDEAHAHGIHSAHYFVANGHPIQAGLYAADYYETDEEVGRYVRALMSTARAIEVETSDRYESSYAVWRERTGR